MATEKSKRKIVWIFGAGASRGAGAFSAVQHGGKVSIPMQSDFWETTLRFSTWQDRKIIEGFLFRYFKGYKKTPPKVHPSKRRTYFADVSVEEVFTFLSERISTPTISSQLKTYFKEEIWEALIRSVAATFKRFHSNSETKAVYKDFRLNHLRTRDSIISFNYDTVLESSLRKTKWYYYGMKKKKVPIFKPHGSINWDTKADKSIKVNNNCNSPIIVAPTHLKFIGINGMDDGQTSGYLNSNQNIRTIWQAMEKQMNEAKAIVFIGYSFPDADLYFSSVLRTVLTKSTSQVKIILVNPDALRISDRISYRFAIDKSNIKNHFDIKSFCKLDRNDLV